MNRPVYLLPLNGSGKCIFLILMCLFLFKGVSQAQTLKADYRFQGGFNSTVSGAPSITTLIGSGTPSFENEVVDGYMRQAIRFPFNSGLAVNTSGVIPNNAYTIVMLLRVDETSGYRRLVSFDNGTTNGGAYILDGRIKLESVTAAQFSADTYIQIVITRDASGNVRIYRDGIASVNIPNDGGEFQISNDNILRFFQDDVLTPTEATAGYIARIRLFDASMTTAQVRLLERTPPAPGTGGLQEILFTSTRDGNREVYKMNGDGSYQKRLTFNESDDYDAKWSSDRTKIVFVRDERIWMMNFEGGALTQLTNTSANDHAPDWQPLGTRILFSRCNAGNVCDLYTMNQDGTDQQPLGNGVNTSGNEDRAQYSMTSDNPRIVFECSASDFSNANICEANADGSNRRQVTNDFSPTANKTPVYTGSRTILFTQLSNAGDPLSADIYVIDRNGTGLRNLTATTNVPDSSPFISYDRTKIVFASRFIGNTTEIYRANASNGLSVQRLTVNSANDVPSDIYQSYLFVDFFPKTPFDFDGDGKSDFGIYRPAQSEWWIQKSITNENFVVQFGQAGDKIVPADYTGDWKTDIAVFRPSNGFWYVLRSENNTFYEAQFGAAGDTPIPKDYDGDGKDDLAVHRPSNNGWYIQRSALGFTALTFGTNGDIPVPGDYDGDHQTDVAIYRPNGATGGEWWIRQSDINSVLAVQFGTAEDIPIPYDFTGDGRTDLAFFRPSNGTWYVLRSSNYSFYGFQFGANGDIPSPGDYDGDGRIDATVFRPNTATWYVLRSNNGLQIFNYGLPTDKPIQSAYIR